MNWKIKLLAALRIWMVIYPSITFFLFFFGNLLSPLPLYQRTLILTLILVPWMVFAGLPLLDSAFKMFSSNGKK